MNLYKGLLYTQGYLLDPQYADDVAPRRAEDRAVPKPTPARTRVPAAAPRAPVESCTAGACG